MKKAISLLLIVALAIVGVFGCTSQNNSTEEVTSVNHENKIEKVEENSVLKKRMKDEKFNPNKHLIKQDFFIFSLEEVESDSSNKEFVYKITNQTEEIQVLNYMTSQRYEYEISNSKGEVIKTFSNGQSFLQVIEKIEVLPDETITYPISLPSLKEGQYTLSVYSAATDIGDSVEKSVFSIK